MFFSGQGKVYLAERDASGNPKAPQWVGNVSKLEVSLNTSTTNKKESYSGQRLTVLILETGKEAALSATFDEWDAANLARVLRAKITAASVTPVVDEVLPHVATDLATVSSLLPVFAKTVGRNIGSVTIKDSTAGTPVTLVAGTHYVVESAAAGIIKFIGKPGSLTFPLKVSYTPGAATQVGMFTEGVKDYYLIFDGINTAEGNKPVVCDLYKVRFTPAQSIPLINDDLGSFEVSGAVMVDSLKPATGDLGQFGNITYPA